MECSTYKFKFALNKRRQYENMCLYISHRIEVWNEGEGTGYDTFIQDVGEAGNNIDG